MVATGSLILLLPEELAYRFCSLLLRLAFLLIPNHRKNTIKHLKIAFPNKNETEIRRLAKKTYSNFAKSITEFAKLPKIISADVDSRIKIVGVENLDSLYKAGKGAIAVTAHLGNWELLGAYLTLKGYKLTVVAREIYYGKFDNYLQKIRRQAGLDVVYRDRTREIVKKLKNGNLLGILPDQDIEKIDSIYVDFFGRLALTPVGPVTLALRTVNSIIPIFIVRNTNNTHTIYTEKPLRLIKTGDKQKDVMINTINCTKIIEKYVRKFPDQWVWIHRRWQHKPEWGFLKFTQQQEQ